MEDPDPILATPLECVPVLEPVTRIPVVTSDEEKATPRASVVLDLLGELANMNQVLSPKDVRDRVNPTRAERNLMEHTGGSKQGKAKQLPGDPINHGTDKGGQQSSIRGGSAGGNGNKGKGKAVDYGFDDEDEDEEGIHGYDERDEDIETDS